MKHKFTRVLATAFMMLAAFSFTAFAATVDVSWTKVKLTNKGNAQWNLDLGEAGKKRDVNHYEVQVYAAEGSLAGYGSYDEWDIIETADHTRHEKLTISDPGTYKFKVRAVMNDGDVTNWSQESNEMTAEVQGTGLGLSITKSLIELMGGVLTIESTLGKGTKVIVHLILDIASQEEVDAAKSKKLGKEDIFKAHICPL